MGTSVANLSTNDYVKINSERKSITLQSLRDEVRIALSSVKPALGNVVFHTLNGGDNTLQFFNIETDVWALAVTESSKLVITETGLINDSLNFASLNNGVEVNVGDTVVELLSANSNRKKLIIQNNGAGDVRIGAAGVSSTTGVRLKRDGVILFENSNCPVNSIHAIREYNQDSVILVQEVV